MNRLVGLVVLLLAAPAGADKVDVAASRRHFDQAHLYISMLDYRRAIEEYRKAYEADPSRVWFVFDIARCYHRLAGTEPDFALKRGYLQRALEGFEFYLAIDPKGPEKDRREALAEMEEIRKDLAKVDEDEKKAAQRQAEEAAEREQERKRMQALEQEKQEMVERSRVLGEKLQRLDAQMVEMRGAEERRRVRRRVQLRLGLPLISTGLASAAVGGGLLGQSGVIAGELRERRRVGLPAPYEQTEQRHRLDLAGGVLIGVSAALLTVGIVILIRTVDYRESRRMVWIAPAQNGLVLGGSFR